MALADIVVESESQGFTTGATPVGPKMNDLGSNTKTAPSPASPTPQPPAPQPQPAGDAGTTRVSRSPEHAQSVIDRMFANPKFRQAWADPNHPDHAALVQAMPALFCQANPEPGEERERGNQNCECVAHGPLSYRRRRTG